MPCRQSHWIGGLGAGYKARTVDDGTTSIRRVGESRKREAIGSDDKRDAQKAVAELIFLDLAQKPQGGGKKGLDMQPVSTTC